MEYTEKEISLAKRYMKGDCNEVQFNYLVHSENVRRERVEQLIEELAHRLPIAGVVKMLLIYMLINLLFCLGVSLTQGL